MATRYTSTIQLALLKEHACAGCGTAYRYPFRRTIKGTSTRSPEQATVAARSSAERSARVDVDPHPCPTCGLLQPDMVGRHRARTRTRLFWLLGVVPLLAFVLGRAGYGFTSVTATWGLTAFAALTALAFAVTEFVDPNRDPEGNRATAAERVAAGTITTAGDRRPNPLATPTRPGRSALSGLAALLLFAAPVAAAAPELLRLARGWPLSPGCYPPVVGPGDATRVFMADPITSIKGYFVGTADAALRPAGGPAVPVPAVTSADHWPGTISAQSNEKQQSKRPWVDLILPADPALANRPADCDVRLDLTYPALAPNGNAYRETEREMSETFPLRLAAPDAGRQYNAAYRGGAAADALLLLGCGTLLIRSAIAMRGRTTVTHTYPLPPAAPPAANPPASV